MAVHDPAPDATMSGDDAHLCEQFVRSAQFLLDRTEAVARRHTLPITTEARVTDPVWACLEAYYLQAGWRRCSLSARAPVAGTRTLPDTRGPAPRTVHSYWLALER